VLEFSLDEPGQFFRGLLPMRWGPQREGRLASDGFYFDGSTGHPRKHAGDAVFAAPSAIQFA
jgi:hypothetical protein